MKSMNTKLAEARKTYETYWESYTKGDLETFASTLDEQFEMIGTSETEVCHSKTDGIEFLKAQLHEVVGKVEMRNRQIDVIPVDNLMLVNEQCDVYVLTDSVWNFYSKIRLSTILRETESGWKVTQQHGSFPDMRVQEGETLAFEKISKENLELRDAIKRRTIELEQKNRELEIEAALERVRSRSLAMHSSNELNEVVTVLFEKLKDLSIPVSAVGMSINIEGSKDLDNYTCGQVESGIAINNYRLPYFDHRIANDFFEAREKQLDFFVGKYSKEEKDSFYEYVIEHTELKNELTEEIKEFIFQSPAYSISVVTTKHTMITLNDFEGGSLSDGEIDILKRFSKVFEQAYIRFLDLQKAEAQAREAQIELALERVRARTMAMQHSDELTEASEVLDKQVRALGIETWGCAFHIYADDPEGDYEWFSSREGTLPFYKTPRENFFLKFYEKGKAGETFHVEEFIGEDCKIHYDFLMTIPVMGDALREIVSSGAVLPESQYDHIAFFKHGFLLFITYKPIPESHAIFQRFAKVFEQTYTRFLDLKKAEAQAREAQIEAALERVRAQTMAMHSSEDVGKCVVKMFSELTALGVDDGTRFGIGILNHDNENNQLWTARKNGEEVNLHIGNIDMASHPLLKSARQAWKAQVPFHKYVLEGEDLLNYYQMLNTAPDYKIQIPIEKLPKKEIQHCFIFEHGFFYAFSPIEFQLELIHITRRFSALFEQTYRRYLDLVKAEAQAREAQIEAALERVRSRTMAMQHSNELTDVAGLLFNQVSALGIKTWTAGFNVWSEDNNSCVDYICVNGRFIDPYTVPTEKAESLKDVSNARKSGVEFAVLFTEGEKIKQMYLAIGGIDEEQYKIMLMEGQVLSHQYEHFVFGSKVSLMFITYEPVPEAHDIFKRLGKVFEQTYTRFLDLQKAEAQAREAQIQLSLERIRAKAMAMQHSDELGDFLTVVFEQFDALNLSPVNCILSLFDIENNRSTFRMTGKNGATLIAKQEIDLDASPVWKQKVEDWKLGHPNDVDVLYIPFENLPEIGEIFKEILEKLPEGERPLPEDYPNGEYIIDGYCKYGYLGYASSRAPSDEEKEITRRIASEFGNVYQRFLDLQKAEAQAREAEIEVALEKVRSRSLAMHKSEELKEVVFSVFERLRELQIQTDSTNIVVYFDESMKMELWTANNMNYPTKFTLSMTNGLYPEDGIEARKEQKVYLRHLPFEGKNRFWKELFNTTEFGKVPQARQNYLLENTDCLIQLVVFGKVTGIMLSRYFNTPFSDVEIEIAERFAKVFDQAYTRFLDLQKAEAQALEANKRASVDRVRGEIASMRTTIDLERIQPLIWNELKILGVPFIRCGVFIMEEAKQEVQAFLSTPDGESIAAFRLPYHATEQTKQIVSHWEQKQSYKDHMDEAAFAEFTRNLVEQGAMASTEKYVTENRPTDLYLHFLPFLQGMMYVGNDAPLKDEELQLVQNLAEAFSTAYARYEDFNKLEMAKSAVEAAMSELKATQSQLVQQEKLASLGQLTAGIAHEIKNPLNFVNNFSEVSMEMIEEVLEARSERRDLRQSSGTEVRSERQEPRTKNQEGERDESEELEDEILEDIKANLKKIHEHGSRANGIVTSMLQHSRGGSGKKEPTDLNALIKEYVNLSFHGMRASKNPINVEIQLDLDESIETVDLVGEDFSRVILNLCNNAFDAMRCKKYEVPSTKYEDGSAQGGACFPKLRVSTSLEIDHILISVEDNGPGIPDDIKDKILQPFFTTKKGTEGTGLGLSITHDIVKAHGGELEIETSINIGTKFIIKLLA